MRALTAGAFIWFSDTKVPVAYNRDKRKSTENGCHRYGNKCVDIRIPAVRFYEYFCCITKQHLHT